MVLLVALWQGFVNGVIVNAGGGGFDEKTLIKGSIVFSSFASGNWEIWSVKPDGTDLKQLTNTPREEHSPAVSPDGKEIVYLDNKRSLQIMNLDGSQVREIPLPNGIYAQPAWSPDGNEIAFVKFTVVPTDESEIWILKREGRDWGEPERVSIHPPMRLYPSFSPDGSQLVYAELRKDRLLGVIEEIGILDRGGNCFKKITEDLSDSFDPVWSPLGDKIVYTSNKKGNYDIWVMTLNDQKDTQLTTDASYDGEPTWSSDGNEIAFVSTRSGNKEIWVVSVDRGRLQQVTNMGKSCKDPFWVR
ncbi:MAG: hypothetical protein D8M57_18520 [Candidatus Scalindua sp. AMX11]|nr:MAG: hypothetical protein D8M57_18520 [Candidatus Scalindua sp. AMX11]GJQ60886.1 MAG: hypothetical protein SCALA701_36870 [Candidatus Scalindua sp.]